MFKKQISKIIMTLIISFIFITGSLLAQSLKVNPKASSMTIYGTTNVHDFKTSVQQINGVVVINSAKKVQSATIEIPVHSIKSGEKLMDNKTYEAFNETKHPTITFSLIDVTSLQINGDDISGIVNGNLTIAGVTKRISFKTAGKKTNPNVYVFKGSIALKMTDFKMKPPTAMLGVMKVGDAITLKYDVTFE